MSDKVFGLNNDEYWSNPKKNVRELVSTLVKERELQLIIDAPVQVELEGRDTFPLLIYYGGRYADLEQRPIREFGMVASINLKDNKVYADKALHREDRPTPPRTGPPRKGRTGQDYSADLFHLLPKAPGDWITTALVFDKVSNRVRSHTGPGPNVYQDDEVEKFLEAQRAGQEPKQASPAEGDPLLVGHEPGDGVPTPPAEVGIELSADRVVVNREGDQGCVRLGFRVPVFKHDVLPDGEEPKAIALVTLLLIGSKNKAPLLFPLQLPCTDVGGDADNPVGTGQVTLNLLSDKRVANKAQTYWVYALSGEVLAGPTPFAVVDEQDLPNAEPKDE